MLTGPAAAPYMVGVSLKMYFGHARTVEWAAAIGDIARRHPAVAEGLVELFVVPTFPSLVPVREALAGAPVRLGAQDLATADSGAFTGEVSGVELAEIGCTLAEVGHAERRALFHEDDAVIAAKTAAALRNGLTPLLCVGEETEAPAAIAALEVESQLRAALADSDEAGLTGPIVVAYEPQWAIGAPEPASPEYIAQVVAQLESVVAGFAGRDGSRVIYGGSAKPGLLTALGGDVKGLFLGRFAHDPAAVELILDEVLTLAHASADATAGGAR
ncbi:triose-phosphate isomerase family protein [Frondihabitans australicus]|uniref:Triosephosphate isomerase n=1 Tax=Frondihabitans australicus TaxID=386892 RepID=A0A495IHJ6_9MICO|nr:triose-phosphate isomerase family protein [Frondihabitans australicus]RKR75170.1 triosephosphate isomerase [Frondihabitans australicus]